MTTCEPIKIGVCEITHYNSVNPHDYVAKIQKQDDTAFYNECKNSIWLSAYAANNLRSDFHFMCDACYDESKRRDNGKTYQKAHDVITRSL